MKGKSRCHKIGKQGHPNSMGKRVRESLFEEVPKSKGIAPIRESRKERN